MNHRFTVHLTALAAVALLLVGASQALAVGTLAGETISNFASLTYNVGSVTPPTVTSSAADFVVDHKVIPVVGNNNGANVVPNGTGYALKFTVENQGNTKASETLQLKLEAVKNAGFDMNSVKIYRDNTSTGSIGNFDIANDTEITASNPFITLAHDASAVIFIVATCPPNGGGTAPLNLATSSYHLLATAWTGGADGVAGLPLAKGDANGLDSEEVVFADAAGSATSDDAGEGQHSASGTYTVATAALSITKTSAVIGGTGFYIPGETVEYTITVTNGTGAATATNITVNDSLDTEITAGTISFTDESILVQAPNLYSEVETALTNAADSDEGQFTANTVTVSGIDLEADESATIKFRVEIR